MISIGIRGAGVAGLSVAAALKERLPAADIQIFDIRPRLPHPHRTFCFFRGPNSCAPVEPSHSWREVIVAGTDFRRRISCPEAPYSLIEGERFFSWILERVESLGVRCHWGCADVAVSASSVQVDGVAYHVDLVVDAAHSGASAQATLWQSFAGIEVEAETEIFDPRAATLMDLNVPESPASVRFMYILPRSPTSALIEHTIFHTTSMPEEWHLAIFRKWLAQEGFPPFTVRGREWGAIPMGLLPTRIEAGVVTIGTAGGAIRASTGYGFQAILRESTVVAERIAESLGGAAPRIFRPVYTYPLWMRYSDELFVGALAREGPSGQALMEGLLRTAPERELVLFLEGRASLREALRVMKCVPKYPMIRALLMSKMMTDRYGDILVTALALLSGALSAFDRTLSEWFALGCIIIAGIPHGSFDLRFAERRWGGSWRARVGVVVGYLASGALMSAVCLLWPTLGLLAFLFISVVHFSEGEQLHVPPSTAYAIGVAAVFLPIALHLPEAIPYVEFFGGGEILAKVGHLVVLSGYALLGVLGILLVRAGVYRRWSTALQYVVCLASWVYLPPLSAFCVWFIGRHSLQHMQRAQPFLKDGVGLVPFDFFVISLLAIVLIVPLGLYFDLRDLHQLFSASIILIAGLTLPHMIITHATGGRGSSA